MGEGESSASEPRRRRGTRFSIGESIGDSDRSTGQGDSTAQSQTAYADQSGEPVSVSRPSRRGRKPDITAAKGAADMMIGVIETFAYSRYRTPDARMTPDERKMALEGLAQSVKVLPAEIVGQISNLSAPVMCLMGFILYANRLGELESRRRANKRDEAISEQANEWLANQQTPTDYAHGPVDANGFAAPSKTLLNDLQELR